MALVKGYCKKCQELGEEPKFFEVNTQNEITYCPFCGYKMATPVPINNYQELFEHYLKEADVLLFRCRDYEASYKAYGRIIDLDNENVVARYGRILSLVYLSTLTTPMLKEAIWIFNSEKTKYLRKCKNPETYILFLNFINEALNKMYSPLNKRLTFRGYFYDIQCVTTYFDILNLIKNFKTILLEEYTFINKKLSNPDINVIISSLDKELNELNKELKHSQVDVTGVVYKCAGINRDDQPIVSYSDEKKRLKLPPFQQKYLGNRPLKIEQIDVNIFRSKNVCYILSKIAIPTFLISAGLSIIFYILSACLSPVRDLLFILGTVSISIAAVVGLFHGIWNLICRFGETHLVMKPFKRK